MDENNALAKAIQVVGSQQALADALGIRSPSITEWKERDSVPAGRCIPIEAATNGAVTRYDLRPDVFGPAPEAHLPKRRAAAEGAAATNEDSVSDVSEAA